MRKFSKIAASALALALSVSMVAPISTNAYFDSVSDKDGTTFTQTDTKTTISTKDYDIETHFRDWEDILAPEVTTKTITVKSYSETMYFITTADAKKIENFKSNSKKLKVKVISKKEVTYDDKNLSTDSDYSDAKATNGKYTYYYRDVNGKIQKTDDTTKLPKNSAEGEYKIRLYAKKAGTYKLTYDVVLEDGTTVKKTVKIIAKEDGSPIKKVTFAGKVIYSSDATEVSGLLQKNGNKFTTKGKGKIKVTPNKDIKIQKIEVGILNNKEEEDNSYYYKYDPVADESVPDKNDPYYKGTKIVCSDEYDNMLYSWKPVKNGKNITLSKVNDRTGNYTRKYYTNGKENGKSETLETTSTTSTTAIRITYLDKKDKTTHREIIYIKRLINK